MKIHTKILTLRARCLAEKTRYGKNNAQELKYSQTP